MTSFHKNFPFGKGMWIWNIPNCEGGNISKIIEKCKRYNFSHVLIKSSDGENSFPAGRNPQLTKEIVDRFHASGISVYSWSYNYGNNPKREAALALWALEQLGVDGHVFDAETEWEKQPDTAARAVEMLSIVRAQQPNAFLAHAPYPYIDYHTRFPYVEFGKYCDAVMPQAYWGTIGITVTQMVADLFAQWSKWEKHWKEIGHADSIKPIIPIGQTYDNPGEGFTQTPAQIVDFISQVAGYGSVNFWDWEHTDRQDLWEALGSVNVKPKSEIPGANNDAPNSNGAGSSTNTPSVPNGSNPQTQPSQPGTTTPAPTQPVNPSSDTPLKRILDGKEHYGWYDDPNDKKNKRWFMTDDNRQGRFLPAGIKTLEELEATYKKGEWKDDYRDGQNKRWWVWPNGLGSFLPKDTVEPLHYGFYVNPETGISQRWIANNGKEGDGYFLRPGQTEPDPAPTTTTPVAQVPVSETGGSTTITVKKDDTKPDGVRVTITDHKPHIDYLLDLIAALLRLLRGGKK